MAKKDELREQIAAALNAHGKNPSAITAGAAAGTIVDAIEAFTAPPSPSPAAPPAAPVVDAEH